MIQKQISAYLENKPGQLLDYIQVLGENNIDLQALCIADTEDYGLLRMIVDQPEKAVDLLKKAGHSCRITEVLSVVIPDRPGAMRKALAALNDAQISFDYCYAFFSKEEGKANLVLRVPDNDEALKALEAAGALE